MAALRMPIVGPSEGLTPDAGAYRPPGAPAVAPGYIEEELFMSGEALGEAYTTVVHVRRPVDPATASGIVVLEPTHGGNLWPVMSTTGAFLTSAGHTILAVSSSSFVVDRLVKPANPSRYERLSVPGTPGVESEILAQVGALLRSSPRDVLGAVPVARLVLAGYSGTGAVVRRFIEAAHAEARLDGRPVYDGYFPGQTAVGAMPQPIADLDVPVIELQGESEVVRTFRRNPDGLTYRRDDGERYRLYEVPSMPHMAGGRPGWACVEPVRTTFPLRAVWSSALHNLIRWVDEGVPAPRAERIHLDGEHVVRDEHGHALGGVRTADIDVPLATLGAVSTPAPENPRGARPEMLGYREDFSAATLAELYGDHASYLDRFEKRLRELVEGGWYLERDAHEALEGARGAAHLFEAGSGPS